MVAAASPSIGNKVPRFKMCRIAAYWSWYKNGHSRERVHPLTAWCLKVRGGGVVYLRLRAEKFKEPFATGVANSHMVRGWLSHVFV